LSYIKNFKRLQYDVGIGYGDDIDRAKQLIMEAVANLEDVLKEPSPDVLVMELAESTVNIRVRWWINPPRRAEALDTRDKVLAAIKNKLTANGIDLPFPTQQILFHDQTEETDGNRSRQREGWSAGNKDVPNSRSISGSLRNLVEMRTQRDGNGNE
jgi:small-conductance mechanosensitive channel